MKGRVVVERSSKWKRYIYLLGLRALTNDERRERYTGSASVETLKRFISTLITPYHLLCHRCHKEKREDGPCPFSEEICGTIQVCGCCNSCQEECAQDI